MRRRRVPMDAAMTHGLLLAAAALGALAAGPMDGSSQGGTAEPRIERLAIPGTALSIELVELPLGDDGTTLWFSRTETTWELLDVFVYNLDEESSTPEADAVTRPSKPYISMDRGFGRHGHPAISVSHRNAVEFCRWLSVKTGRAFRLPTREEWSRACALGGVPSDRVQEFAWCRENSERRTHPVGSRRADAAGLHDMLGNACEWVHDGESFVVMGGSYRDPAERLGCGLAVPADPEWNASDPQIPRGEWWLADAGFVGFRVVCEPVPAGGAVPPAAGAADPSSARRGSEAEQKHE